MFFTFLWKDKDLCYCLCFCCILQVSFKWKRLMVSVLLCTMSPSFSLFDIKEWQQFAGLTKVLDNNPHATWDPFKTFLGLNRGFFFFFLTHSGIVSVFSRVWMFKHSVSWRTETLAQDLSYKCVDNYDSVLLTLDPLKYSSSHLSVLNIYSLYFMTHLKMNRQRETIHPILEKDS